MTLTITARGKHTAATVIATLKSRLGQAENDNVALTAANEDLVCELTRAVIRSCQDGIHIAELETELAAVKAANEDLRRKTIRAQAEQERLRRAVINARPRITVAETGLVRPYITGFRLPYLSAIPYRDTSNDETQQLPVLDWPKYPAPAAT